MSKIGSTTSLKIKVSLVLFNWLVARANVIQSDYSSNLAQNLIQQIKMDSLPYMLQLNRTKHFPSPTFTKWASTQIKKILMGRHHFIGRAKMVLLMQSSYFWHGANVLTLKTKTAARQCIWQLNSQIILPVFSLLGNFAFMGLIEI